jgi:hypothetical protein
MRDTRGYRDVYDRQPGPMNAFFGTIEDSVEGAAGWNPAGLVGATGVDLPTGVRVTLPVTVASRPSAGINWSVPLRGARGRPIVIGAANVAKFKGRLGLMFTVFSKEITAWAAKATPSNGVYWVGMINGPAATATAGFVAMVENTGAGTQRVGWSTLAAGAWGVPAYATTLHADTTGTVSGHSPCAGGSDGVGYSTSVYPYAHSVVGVGHRIVSANSPAYGVSHTPHLIFGAGRSGVGPASDSITFLPGVVSMGIEDLLDLEG